MPRYRYQRHRAEDKKSLKGLVREVKGTDGKSFHEFVGNALVEFCGFEQEKNEADARLSSAREKIASG